MSQRSSHPPALLFLGDYYGTLAAARCLGERGIDVALADESRFARTAASKHVKRFIKAPPLADATAFMQWLIHMGPELEGHVLFPASDELVFHFAQHRAELAKYYKMYLPKIDTIFRILNKQRLSEACAKTGVDSPRTWFPRGEEELKSIVSELDCEVILKPKTQIQLRTGVKAAEVPEGADLVASFRAFVKQNPYGRELLAHDPDVVWPMVQAYHRQGAYSIYSLSGFADGTSRLPLVRASRKVLQRPRKLGIGLCFEGITVLPELRERVGALCVELGYEGMFEIEFIEHEGKHLLIDFNPRGYSQMAFEVSRAMPLPYLNYLRAVGDDEAFEKERAIADAWAPRGTHVYCHETLLGIVISGQTLASALRGVPSEHWERWVRDHRAELTDAVRSKGDPGPVLVDTLKHLREALRHPRSFLRSFSR